MKPFSVQVRTGPSEHGRLDQGERGGGQGPRLPVSKCLSSNPASTLSICVTSANKLLHPSKTSLSSLWADKEMVLPQRVVGMLTWDKAWKHLALYLMIRCPEYLINDRSLSTRATPSMGSLPSLASGNPAPKCSFLWAYTPSAFTFPLMSMFLTLHHLKL